jgi:hypothetical protein
VDAWVVMDGGGGGGVCVLSLSLTQKFLVCRYGGGLVDRK